MTEPDDSLDLARALVRGAAATGRRTTKAARPRRKSAQFSGSGPDARDPQLLGHAIERLADDHGWDDQLRDQGLLARWPSIVGPELSQHCHPEGRDGTTLKIRTDSTAWATQLRLLAPELVRRLNAELGQGSVTLVEVIGPSGPTWKKGPRSVRDGRGPRDTYG